MKRKSIFLIWLLMIQSSITNQCTSEDSGKKEHLASQAAGGGKRFVLIEVNGEPIYKDELSKKLETFQKRLSPLVSEKKKVDPGILLSSVSKNLVQDKLILQEATRQNVFVIESEVEAAVKKNTVGYTPELLRSLLREKGVTQREWREEISKRLLREKISRQVIEKSLTVTDEEIQEYYKENQNKFVFPLQVRALHILVLAREKADSLQEELLNGADFGELALQHSVAPEAKKGGDLGFFSVGQMPEEFERVIFELKVGEVSDVLGTPYGFHLFTLVEKRTPVKKKSNLAVKMIRKRLMDQKRDHAYKVWLNTLIQKADVKYIENWKSYIVKEKSK